MSILKKLLAPVLDQLKLAEEERDHHYSAVQSKLDRHTDISAGFTDRVLAKLVKVEDDCQAWKAGELVVDVAAVSEKFTAIQDKLDKLYERLSGVGDDVDNIDLSEIDFSSIESAVESAIESGCEMDTSDLDYSIERCMEEARDASSIASENRTSLEELNRLFKSVWPDSDEDEPEPEPEPEPEEEPKPEHDALEQFAVGEYPVVQIRIIGKKVLICDQLSVVGEHYLPDTTADAMKAFVVKTMAPICDQLAVDRPWMANYNWTKSD